MHAFNTKFRRKWFSQKAISKTQTDLFNYFRCARYHLSDEVVARDLHVKEWKLVYSPLNPALEELVDIASKSLQLDGVVGVNSSEELEAVMFNRELVAGIEFQHSSVNFCLLIQKLLDF